MISKGNKGVKLATSVRPSFWRRSHHLDKMTLKELVVAYVQYPAIIAYTLLSLVAIGLYVAYPAPLIPTVASVQLAALV